MKKILVSIPNTGWIHKHCVFALLRLQLDRRYKLTFILPTHNPLENNQHHIIPDFISGRYDYWLSFDSDNPPMQNPLDLVELNKDIIICPTPVWHFTGKEPKGERPVYWNVLKYVSETEGYTEWPIKEGLQEVDAAGMGCFLLSRRVFDNMEMRQAPFLRTTYPDGRVEKGNDISFCEKAKKQGFEIYAHFDYPCMHFNEIELNELTRAFQNLYE